ILDDGRNAAEPDALGDRSARRGLGFAVLEPFVHGGAPGVGDPDHDVLVFFAQISAGARERSAGPDRTDERVEFAAGLLPDFWTSRYIMRLAVVQIVPLVGEQYAMGLCFAKLIGEPFCHVLVIVRIAVGQCRYFDEFSAAQP